MYVVRVRILVILVGECPEGVAREASGMLLIFYFFIWFLDTRVC